MDKAPHFPMWVMWAACDSYMCPLYSDNIPTDKSFWAKLHKQHGAWTNLYDLRMDLRVPALQKWSKISPAKAASTDIDIVRTLGFVNNDEYGFLGDDADDNDANDDDDGDLYIIGAVCLSVTKVIISELSA